MLIVPFLVADGTENAINDGIIKDQRLWSIVECSQVMATSIEILHQRLKVTRAMNVFHGTTINRVLNNRKRTTVRVT